jgi:hypothetical protein
VDAAGKSTNCQILTTTTGGHRPLLAGTRSCREATLYRHLPNVCCHNDCPSIPERPSLTVTGSLHCLTPEIAAPLRQRLVLVSLQNWPYSFGFFPSSISLRFRFTRRRVSGAELRDSRDRLGNRGSDYERAVRSDLWVRVNYHVHSSVRRALIWTSRIAVIFRQRSPTSLDY